MNRGLSMLLPESPLTVTDELRVEPLRESLRESLRELFGELVGELRSTFPRARESGLLFAPSSARLNVSFPRFGARLDPPARFPFEDPSYASSGRGLEEPFDGRFGFRCGTMCCPVTFLVS